MSYKATLHTQETTRNQTTLGLAVKPQHRHGSSELIRILHDHGFIVSYDEVIRFRKSAAKFVGDSDRSSILHQAMGLSRRVGPIFGLFDNLDLLVSTPNGRRDTHVMAQEFEQHPSCILETGSGQPGSMNLVSCDPMPTAVCFTISQNQHQQVCSSLALHGAEKSQSACSPNNIGDSIF